MPVSTTYEFGSIDWDSNFLSRAESYDACAPRPTPQAPRAAAARVTCAPPTPPLPPARMAAAASLMLVLVLVLVPPGTSYFQSQLAKVLFVIELDRRLGSHDAGQHSSPRLHPAARARARAHRILAATADWWAARGRTRTQAHGATAL